MTSSPEKPDKNSDSSDNSDSDSSSSGSGSSSSSSDSESENEDGNSNKEKNESIHNALSTSNDEESTSPSKPFNPNPTRAAARFKEAADTGLQALGVNKRDRRSIEEIMRDMKKDKVAKTTTKSEVRAPARRVVSPALQPVPENITIPNPNSIDVLKSKGKPKTARDRLTQKISGRGSSRTASKAAPKTSIKPNSTVGVAINISRPSTTSTSSTPPTSQTSPPATSPIQNEVDDPKNNTKVVRTLIKALQRYGDLTDGNMYTEHQATFCDEYKQPGYLTRAKLSSHTRVSEESLKQIAIEIINICDTAVTQKEESLKYAEVDIKPAAFFERLYENLKLRVAVQRAMAAAKCKGGAHNLLPLATNLIDFGIDQMPIWKSAEEECDWNQEKDRALLLGLYLHGFSAWEEILADKNLNFEKQRVLKGSRLKTRAENILKKLPSPTKLATGGVSTSSGGGRMQRAAERAEKKVDGPPSTSPPPADSIRRDHIMSNPYGGKQLRLVPQQTIASEDEEGEIRSDSEDEPVGRPYGGKNIRMPPPVVQIMTKALLSSSELDEKWDPKERLKNVRQTLKKLKKISSWAASQSDDAVLEKVSKYIIEIGADIDQQVAKEDEISCDELATCLWTHAATFTPLTPIHFERLYDDMVCDATDTSSL